MIGSACQAGTLLELIFGRLGSHASQVRASLSPWPDGNEAFSWKSNGHRSYGESFGEMPPMELPIAVTAFGLVGMLVAPRKPKFSDEIYIPS